MLFKGYSHICVLKQIGDLVNQWAVICEFCPGCYVAVSVIVLVVVVVSVL